jgi:hypothetical protein
MPENTQSQRGDVSQAAVQKLDALTDAGRGQQMPPPWDITLTDADGNLVFETTVTKDQLENNRGFALGEMRGRAPLTGTLTDSTGKTITR